MPSVISALVKRVSQTINAMERYIQVTKALIICSKGHHELRKIHIKMDSGLRFGSFEYPISNADDSFVKGSQP